MTKLGEAWIDSPERRALESSLVIACAPPLGGLACGAAGVIAATEGPSNVIHRAERALYPGDYFTMRKLGDPESDSPILTLFRKAMLDELPQAIDILQGRMSLIGPRADKPTHIANLFDAIEDDKLRERWAEVRAKQKPGIISSYAIESHSRNLEASPEYVRFSADETLRRNALRRARLDIDDFDRASLRHDVRLLGAAGLMVKGNYLRYFHNTRQRKLQTA